MRLQPVAQQIAFMGAGSQLARDLIQAFVAGGRKGHLLYVRNIEKMQDWLAANGLADACALHPLASYGDHPHDAVLNFIGVGDPQRAADMGPSILEVTHRFDDMILTRLDDQPGRRYVFISSGAAYGQGFVQPATHETLSSVAINAVTPQTHYGVAKLYAEVRHRSLSALPIVDLRVFNYFSRTQDISARFFITDILRAVQARQLLRASPGFMVRDYLHPADFYQLVVRVLDAPPVNCVLDAYSREPIDKPTLLRAMQERFGLRYEFEEVTDDAVPNATGSKPYYYSLNRKAQEFGYQPAYSSLDGLMHEFDALLR